MMGLRRRWEKLWWSMAEHDASRYRVIKGMDVIEFWTLFDAWKTKYKQK